jgi:hypothetical protein
MLSFSSSDQSHEIAMQDWPSQEVKLLDIQSQLDTWYSLIPHCVTLSYHAGNDNIGNNGMWMQ